MNEIFDLIAHLRRQRAFSKGTFGPGPCTAGLVDHIRKGLDEILTSPNDLLEWVDVAILAFDGAWRAGYSPEEIAFALQAKQDKNEQRSWRTAEHSKLEPGPINRSRECSNCAGTGKVPSETTGEFDICPVCKGSGYILVFIR